MELKEKFIDKLKKTGTKYTLHNCSMCNYPCGWFMRGEKLYYDSGCNCVNYNNTQQVDNSELDFYFNPEHGHIKNFEEFLKE